MFDTGYCRIENVKKYVIINANVQTKKIWNIIRCFKMKHIFPQGVSCLPAPGDTYHLNDCMVIADINSKGKVMVVLMLG